MPQIIQTLNLLHFLAKNEKRISKIGILLKMMSTNFGHFDNIACKTKGVTFLFEGQFGWAKFGLGSFFNKLICMLKISINQNVSLAKKDSFFSQRGWQYIM